MYLIDFIKGVNLITNLKDLRKVNLPSLNFVDVSKGYLNLEDNLINDHSSLTEWNISQYKRLHVSTLGNNSFIAKMKIEKVSDI